MKPLDGLLTSTGASSTMRVGMLTCIFTGCLIAAYTIYDGTVTAETNTLVFRLLALGFAGKTIQKFAEVK